MKRTVIYMGACLGFAGGWARGEILTNVFDQHMEVGYLRPWEFDTGAGFNLEFGSYTQQMASYVEVGVGSSFIPDVNHTLIGFSQEGDQLSYDIEWGDILNDFTVGTADFDGPVTQINMYGEPGSMRYIQFGGYTGLASPAAHSFGYLQIEIQESHWNLIGWKMGTEESDFSSFEVTNLVPAPSGMAALSIAGLGVTRRRRS